MKIIYLNLLIILKIDIQAGIPSFSYKDFLRLIDYFILRVKVITAG